MASVALLVLALVTPAEGFFNTLRPMFERLRPAPRGAVAARKLDKTATPVEFADLGNSPISQLLQEQKSLLTACVEDSQCALEEADLLQQQLEALEYANSLSHESDDRAKVDAVSKQLDDLLTKAKEQKKKGRSHRRAIEWLEEQTDIFSSVFSPTSKDANPSRSRSSPP